jgi:predicted 2-oxoglutarate/Fe(II)-dependent dioxygenase YbiX
MVNFLWLQGLQTNHKKRRQFLGLLRAIDALYKSTNDKAGLHH